MKKTIIAAAALLLTSVVHADHFVVNVFDPFPGKVPQLIASAEKAKAIHEKNGAQVFLAQDNLGRMHYGMFFETYAAQDALFTKMQGNAEWQAYIAEINAEPSADLVESNTVTILMTTEGEPEPAGFYMRATWKPIPGKAGQMLANAQKAKAIHEKGGARVVIGRDQLGNMIYVLNFKDSAHYAEYMDAPNEEFNAFMREASQDPAAIMIDSARGPIR